MFLLVTEYFDKVMCVFFSLKLKIYICLPLLCLFELCKNIASSSLVTVTFLRQLKDYLFLNAPSPGGHQTLLHNPADYPRNEPKTIYISSKMLHVMKTSLH